MQKKIKENKCTLRNFKLKQDKNEDKEENKKEEEEEEEKIC